MRPTDDPARCPAWPPGETPGHPQPARLYRELATALQVRELYEWAQATATVPTSVIDTMHGLWPWLVE